MGVDVVANINYFSYSTDGSPAWLISTAIPAKVRTNFVQAPVQVIIHDLRGKEDSVNLDTNGLEVVKYNGSVQKLFEQGSEAQKAHYEEISDILKKRLGASRILIYHHSFRFRGPPAADEQCDDNHRNPTFYPHVDRDGASVRTEIEKQLGQVEAEKVKNNRFQMINVWRPVGPHPITRNPLAICDYRSIDVDKDVKPMTTRLANGGITAYTLSHNANDAHKWYYLSHMRSDEMFVFKQFDSKADVAPQGFHTAVEIDSEPTPTEEQLSLEMRALVFYDD